jgi:threonine dehydrogenase-like Zn-dependent dehydrogenase
MNKIYNIAVVGAGQLGSRHLQSLKGIQLDVRIVVIDPNQESLEIAKL